MDLLAELFVSTMFFTVPGYFVLQVWLAKSWSGRWRLAALAPLLVIGPAMLFSFYALSHGSNLWPIAVVFLAPLGFVYLLAVWSTRTAVDG